MKIAQLLLVGMFGLVVGLGFVAKPISPVFAENVPVSPPTTPPTSEAPIITTDELSVAVADQEYRMVVRGYDPNTNDAVAMSFFGLPESIKAENCTSEPNPTNTRTNFKCVLTGTPPRAMTRTVTVNAIDRKGNVTQKTFTLRVLAEPNVAPVMMTTSLPAAQRGLYYDQIVRASDDNETDELNMAITNLPSGLSVGNCSQVLSADGTKKIARCRISGVPTQSGTVGLIVKVNDTIVTTEAVINLTVNP